MGKRRGSNAERELAKKFYEKGFAVLRVAGSGAAQYPTPDLLVMKDDMVLAIECKMRKQPFIYLTEGDVQTLKAFRDRAGCEAYFAIKFLKHGWHFYPLQEVIDQGKPYKILLKEAGAALTIHHFVNGMRQKKLV